MSGVISPVRGDGWTNKHWSGIPDYLRVILDDLAEFLKRPVFPNGIVVGDGSQSTRDPDTGVRTIVTRVAVDKDGVHSTKPGESVVWNIGTDLQSQHYDDSGHQWPGWKLFKGYQYDAFGAVTVPYDLAQFDRVEANVINSRGTSLRFQFVGTDVDVHSGDGGSISMSQDGALSAPSVVTGVITNNVDGGPTLPVVINGGAHFSANGGLDNDIYLRVGGVDVSLVGHTHSYLTQAAGDLRYDALGAASSAVSSHVAAGDPHTAYLTNTRGDTRYYTKTQADTRYVLASGSGSAYGNNVNFLTPDTNGEITFNHGFSGTPTWAVVNFDGRETLSGHWGGSLATISVHDITSTTITLRIHRSDTGAPVTPSYLAGGGFTYVAFYFACGQ